MVLSGMLAGAVQCRSMLDSSAQSIVHPRGAQANPGNSQGPKRHGLILPQPFLQHPQYEAEHAHGRLVNRRGTPGCLCRRQRSMGRTLARSVPARKRLFTQKMISGTAESTTLVGVNREAASHATATSIVTPVTHPGA